MKTIVNIVLALFLISSASFAQQGERFVEGSAAWDVLAPERVTLTQRFQNYSPEPRFQMIQHRSGAATIFVFFPGAGPRPALFGVAPDKTILWRNYDPLPGDHSYLPRLAADDNGNALIAWEDTKPRGIHARRFDGQGRAVWTEQVAALPWSDKVEEQDYFKRLNVLFWPKHGWVIAHSTFRRAVVQLLDVQGQKRWREGVNLVSKQNDDNPISLIQDSPNSIFVLWYEHGFLEKPPTKSVFQAQRIDAKGDFLWPKPVLIGEAPDFAMTIPREIKLVLLPDSKVRADLYRGMAGDAVWQITEYQAFIDSNGQVQTEQTPANK